MEYIQNLVLIGIYFMLELKFDEDIRYKVRDSAVATSLMHSFWQNAGRAMMIFGILWNQQNPTQLIALATLTMYVLWYWWAFDSLFAVGVLNKKPWFLGTTSWPDKIFPKWSHFYVWAIKFLAFVASIIWVYKIS